MSKIPKITVLMPVYNGEEYLESSINSILNQSYSDFELLIIDDGSTDKSIEIIRSYKDSRVRVVSNTTNVGLVKSLNKGIALSRGAYIARMDCDDISEKNRFEKQINFFIENPDVGVCGSWLKVIDLNNIFNYPIENQDIKSVLLFYCCLGHPSVMIKKNILSQNNIMYRECYAEDYDLWVQLSMVTKLANINEPLVNYRMGTSMDRLSNRFFIKQQESGDEIRKRQLKRIGLFPATIELEIHKSISERRYRYNSDYKLQVENWFEKMIAAIAYSDNCYSVRSIEKIREQVLSVINLGMNRIKQQIKIINENAQGRDIFIWGTGDKAKNDYIILKENSIDIKGFIDNDEMKWGQEFIGRKVISPNELINVKEIFIIISTMYEEEVMEQLNTLNLYRGKDYSALSYLREIETNDMFDY